MSRQSLMEKYAEVKARRENGEGGFTLIELLVVVVIIGILVAIAIPLYLNYRSSAQDDSAKSDVRNAVTSIEAANSKPVTLTLATFQGATYSGHVSDGTSNWTYKAYNDAAGSVPAGATDTVAAYCVSETSAAGNTFHLLQASAPSTGSVTSGGCP